MCLRTWSLKIMHMLENSSIPTAGTWVDLQISMYDLLSWKRYVQVGKKYRRWGDQVHSFNMAWSKRYLS